MKTLETLKEAKVFSNPAQRWLLLSCAREARTASELVKIMDLSMDKVHYSLRRLMDAGLIKVAGAIPRNGREMKLYKAVDTSFFIPSDFITDPYRDMRAMETEQVEQARIRYTDGMRVEIDAAGRMTQTLVQDSPMLTSAANEIWLRLNLSDRQAGQLFDEIQQVVEKYRTNQKPGKKTRRVLHLSAFNAPF